VGGLIAQSPSGAWNSGAAILTFAFPMLLFVAVAGALYVLYTKPEVAPGHRAPERPISYTAIPGQPTTEVSETPAEDHGGSVAEDRTQPAETGASAETGAAAAETDPDIAAGTGAGEAVKPEDAG
jgi:hypothetical protein